MSERTRARKGDRIECPVCHRWVGYWPDKLDYHRCHLMPHLFRDRSWGVVHGPGTTAGGWCEGREFNG